MHTTTTRPQDPSSGLGRTVGEIFEDMPFTTQHWKAGLALFLVLVIEGWEMMVLVLGASHVSKDLNIDSAQLGSIVGALFLGMIPGTLVWGKLIDRWGRNRSTVLSLAGYGVISLVSAFSPNVEVLWGLRFVCGLVLSGTIICTFLYFEELLPIHARGKATVYLAAGWPLGLLVSIAAAQLLGDLGWRWMVGVSSLAGLWALVVKRVVPESPYWLSSQARDDEAREVLARLSGDPAMLTIEIKPLPIMADAAERPSILELFTGGHLKTTLLQYIIGFCFSCGYWGLSGMMPVLLAKKGLSTPEGYGFMALSALFMFPGYMSASWLTGRFGRKSVMLVYVLGSTIAGFGLAYSHSRAEMYAWNFALSFLSLGGWGIWNTWLGEIYDTRLRGLGYSSGMSVQRIANALAPIVVGAMAATHGFTEIVSFIAMFLAATLVALLFLPETEGHALG